MKVSLRSGAKQEWAQSQVWLLPDPQVLRICGLHSLGCHTVRERETAFPLLRPRHQGQPPHCCTHESINPEANQQPPHLGPILSSGQCSPSSPIIQGASAPVISPPLQEEEADLCTCALSRHSPQVYFHCHFRHHCYPRKSRYCIPTRGT